VLFRSGLWHGASWTFVGWGLYYGVMLVLERFFLSKVLERVPSFFRHAYLLLVVIVGWVLFMSPSIEAAKDVLSAMVGLSGPGLMTTFDMLRVIQPVYIVSIIVAIIGSAPWYKAPKLHLDTRPVLGWFLDAGLIVVVALSAVMMVVRSFSPFLYFKF
jgi:alginate O-acetyltransferase complex protein AlgI